jgi:uncharacterized SAM-dependent methyltransferase
MPNTFLTNYKVAQKYDIAPGTVQNWIERAVKGELPLEVGENEGRIKIKDTDKNRRQLLILSQKATKYDRRKESAMKVQVSQELYQLLNPVQINKLIKGLRSGEIPLKLAYLGKGVDLWNSFYERTKQSTSYTAKSTYDYFIKTQFEYILSKFYDEFNQPQKINVVDLGAGNGDPIVPLLKGLEERGLLNAYLALDISKGLLDSIDKTLADNQLSHIRFEKIVCDFEDGMPAVELAKFNQGEQKVVPSLYVAFGGQIQNNEIFDQLHIIHNIRYVMYEQDRLLIWNTYHNKESTPDYPAFEHSQVYDFLTWLPNMLGINDQAYSPVFEYNPIDHKRWYGLKLNVDLEIEFKERNVTVKLKKDDVLCVWKHRRENSTNVDDLAAKSSMILDLYASNAQNDAIIYGFRI